MAVVPGGPIVIPSRSWCAPSCRSTPPTRTLTKPLLGFRRPSPSGKALEALGRGYEAEGHYGRARQIR